MLFFLVLTPIGEEWVFSSEEKLELKRFVS